MAAARAAAALVKRLLGGPYSHVVESGSSPAVVRPRAPLLAALAAGVAVASVATAFVMQSPRALVFVAVVSAAWAGQQLIDRGRLLCVEFHDAGNVVLASTQDELRLGSDAMGAIGFSGSVIAGRLSMPFGRFEPLDAGRIVVVDRAGNVLVALRAGWMALASSRPAPAKVGIAGLGVSTSRD